MKKNNRRPTPDGATKAVWETAKALGGIALVAAGGLALGRGLSKRSRRKSKEVPID